MERLSVNVRTDHVLTNAPVRRPLQWRCADFLAQTVRLYDIDANEQKTKFDHRAAILACAFADNERAFSGGLDTSVRECVYAIRVSAAPL